MQALTAYLLLSLLRGALLFALLKLLDAILPIRLRLAWQKRSAYVFLLLLMLTPWCRFTFPVSSPMQAPRPNGETDAPIPPPLPQFMPRKPGKQLRISDAAGDQPAAASRKEAFSALSGHSAGAGPADPVPTAYILTLLVLTGCRLGQFLLWRRRISRQPEIEDPRLCSLFEENCRACGIQSRSIRLLSGSGLLAVPASFGAGRILLPEKAVHFTDHEIGLLLRHELIHLKRRDPFWNFAVSIIAAVFWFNPFLYWLRRRMKLSMEFECDRQVLDDSGGEPETASLYARLMLSFHDNSSRSAPLLGLSTTGRELKERIQGVYMKRNSKRTERIVSFFVIPVAAAVILLTPGAAGQPEPNPAEQKDRTAASASPGSFFDYLPNDILSLFYLNSKKIETFATGSLQLDADQTRRLYNRVMSSFPNAVVPLAALVADPTGRTPFSPDNKFLAGTDEIGFASAPDSGIENLILIRSGKTDWETFRKLGIAGGVLTPIRREGVRGVIVTPSEPFLNAIAGRAIPFLDRELIAVVPQTSIDAYLSRCERDTPRHPQMWNLIGQLEGNRYTGVYLLEAVRDSTVRRELGVYIHLGDGISLGVDWLHRNPFTPQEIADFKPNLARLFSNLAPGLGEAVCRKLSVEYLHDTSALIGVSGRYSAEELKQWANGILAHAARN